MGDARSFLLDRRGSTAIEYALIASLVAVGALAGYLALAGGAGSLWGHVGDALAAVLGD